MTHPLTNDTIIASAIMPPWAKLDNVFNAEEMEQLISYCGQFKLDEGLIGSFDKLKSDKELRKSQIKMLESNAETQWIFERLNAAIFDANSFFFRFDLVGYDFLQYTEYSNFGDNYGFHTDMSYGKDGRAEPHAHRKLSFSLILSDETEYQGADLEFMVSTDEKVKCQQKKGDLILFPAWVLHRVTPIISGTRKSLVGWVTGPKFK
jgi:PKHD-type hydroxylase